MSRHEYKSGFTLIELSIVLVIIGLLVGGVLVGQDLINIAYVRAEVTQLERYNTAVNTFNVKYGGLPGDLPNPSNYFNNPTIAGYNGSLAGQGNADGLIQSSNSCASSSYNCIIGETTVFWYELNLAALIPDATTKGRNFIALPVISSSYIPNGKISGSTINVNSYSDGKNYWVLANESGAVVLGSSQGIPPINAPGLTVSQAFQIDTKIDDGIPNTGTVLVISGGTPGIAAETNSGVTTDSSGGTTFTTPSITAHNCTSGAGAGVLGNIYNIAAGANNVNCQLSVRTNF